MLWTGSWALLQTSRFVPVCMQGVMRDAETLFAEPQGKSDARIFTVTVSRVTHRQFCHDKNHLHDTTVVPLHPSSLRRALKQRRSKRLEIPHADHVQFFDWLNHHNFPVRIQKDVCGKRATRAQWKRKAASSSGEAPRMRSG